MLKKIDGFIIGLICMIALAWFFPLSEKATWFNLETITDIGISLIFFFYGLKLSPKEMKKGISNYKLHLLIQTTTFLFFPLIVLCLLPFVKNENMRTLWFALFFLSALPSTVSSSVVMVSIAKGNISGAIFNASLSGLLGVIVTPLWIGIFMNTSNANFNLYDSVISLLAKILLPVIIGLLLNKYIGHIAQKNSRYLTLFDKTIILAIVYNSFSKSFTADIFSHFELSYLLYTLLITIGIFMLVYFGVLLIANKLNFSEADRITAAFCGSKKSLVHGTVMVKVLFKDMATQGVFIVPIMIYHSFQLVVISFIAQKMAQKNKNKTESLM